jgi:hypothetical protein
LIFLKHQRGARALLNELDRDQRRDYDSLVRVLNNRYGSAERSVMFLGLTSLRRSLISPSGIASMKCSNERALLNELDRDQRRDYDSLVKVLNNRYGSAERSELYRAKLQTRIRGKDSHFPNHSPFLSISEFQSLKSDCQSFSFIDVFRVNFS